jgi:hypothetical protein
VLTFKLNRGTVRNNARNYLASGQTSQYFYLGPIEQLGIGRSERKRGPALNF